MDSVLTIKISNTNSQQKPWNVFGFNEGFSNQPGVLVSISQSSLDMATRESATVPFIIDKMKIKSNDGNNLDNGIIMHYKDSTGRLFEAQFTPSEYLEPSYYVQNMVVIPNPNIEIAGNIALQGTINANSSITILIDITKKKLFSSFLNSVINMLGDYKIKISRQITPGTQIVLK